VPGLYFLINNGMRRIEASRDLKGVRDDRVGCAEFSPLSGNKRIKIG